MIEREDVKSGMPIRINVVGVPLAEGRIVLDGNNPYVVASYPIEPYEVQGKWIGTTRVGMSLVLAVLNDPKESPINIEVGGRDYIKYDVPKVSC